MTALPTPMVVTPPVVWSELLKIEHLVMCLATMAYVYAPCAVQYVGAVCVTIISTGGKV